MMTFAPFVLEKIEIKLEPIVLKNLMYCIYIHLYMLCAGWELRIGKNCDRSLENAARGRRPRAAFSSPKSQFFAIRTDPKPR